VADERVSGLQAEVRVLRGQLARYESDERKLARRYIDIVGVILLALDRAGNVSLMNQRGCELLGYSEEELLGHNWFEVFLPPQQVAAAKERYAIVLAGLDEAIECYESVIIRRDGEERTIAWRSRLVRNSAGESTGILCSGEDVTDVHAAEAERARLELSFHQTHELRSLGTLAGGIAHDFNNILLSICGHAELLSQDLPEGTPAAQLLGEVTRAADRGRRLVRQISSFGRPGALHVESSPLSAVVREVLGLLQATQPESIDVHESFTGHGTVLADTGQLHQVIMNLCTNAIHAMPEGGVLEVRIDDVELRGAFAADLDLPSARYARLTVADDGHGMSAETLERIYEPFFTTKGINQGSGLGLSVVHSIVQAHHGAIHVWSEHGCGSAFRLFLPLQEEASSTPPQSLGR